MPAGMRARSGCMKLGLATLVWLAFAPPLAEAQSGLTYIRCSSTVTMSRINNIREGQRYASTYALNNGNRSVQEWAPATNQWRGWQAREFSSSRVVASFPNVNNCAQVATFDRNSGGYVRTTQCPGGPTLSHSGTCERTQAPAPSRPQQRF